MISIGDGQFGSRIVSHRYVEFVPHKLGRSAILNKKSGLPKYVSADVTINGTPRHVYRRNGKKITILGEPGTLEFYKSYFDAIDGRYQENSVRDRKRKRARSQFARLLLPAFNSARKRAYENGWAFGLTLEALLGIAEKQQFKCCMTGLEFQAKWKPGKRNPYGVSIDRIDCSRGYELENVRLVVFAVNMLLLDWGADVADHVALAYVAKRGL